MGESLVFNVSYARETRNGNKNTTFYGGPNYEVATPIDYTTDNFRFGGEYAKGRFFANAAADFSNFTNDVQYAEIDNPERLQLKNPNFPTARTVYNDAAAFRLWLPPDNKAYTVDLTGGVTLAQAAQAHGLAVHRPDEDGPRADRHLDQPRPRPAAAEPRLHDRPALRQHRGKDGHVHGPGEAHRRSLRPSSGTSCPGRKFELTDKTEEYHFTSTVRGDVGASYSADGIHPRSTRAGPRTACGRRSTSCRCTGLRLGAQFAEEKRTYDIREYADVKDNVWTLSGDYARNWLAFHLVWTNFDRKPGDANSAAIPPSWDGRDPDRHLGAPPPHLERPRHPHSDREARGVIHRAEADQRFRGVGHRAPRPVASTPVGVDVTYAANEKVSFFAGYVYEKYFFKMDAAYIPRGTNPPFDPANLWENDTTDKVDTFRAGLDWVLVPDRFDFNATFDYTKPRSDSLYDFALPGTPIGGLNEANGIFPANVPPIPGFPPTTYDRFPLVTKKFIMAKLRLAYHVSKNLTASAMYWKQKYDNTDWQTDLMQPYMGRVDPGVEPLVLPRRPGAELRRERLPGLGHLQLLGSPRSRTSARARSRAAS